LFNAEQYLSLKKNKPLPGVHYIKKLNAKPNEKLFRELIDWRAKKADDQKIMPNMVLSEQTLAAIAEKLPPLIKSLSAVKGVGAQKASQYGPEIITLIRNYQHEISGIKEQHSLF
jgi:superfamily II DNA helicase RecQ